MTGESVSFLSNVFAPITALPLTVVMFSLEYAIPIGYSLSAVGIGVFGSYLFHKVINNVYKEEQDRPHSQ